MNPTGEPPGIILLCDGQGKILQVDRDGIGIPGQIIVGDAYSGQ